MTCAPIIARLKEIDGAADTPVHFSFPEDEEDTDRRTATTLQIEPDPENERPFIRIYRED